MSFICNKNTVRITLCIIYTGNKAKTNVDKFYSLLLFCFWIKKKSSNELFFNIVKFAWGLFHFCFKEKRKKINISVFPVLFLYQNRCSVLLLAKYIFYQNFRALIDRKWAVISRMYKQLTVINFLNWPE